MTTNKKRCIPLGIGPLEIRTFLDEKFHDVHIASVSCNKYWRGAVVDGSIYISTDRTEKAHDLEVPVLDRGRERRAPMNFRVDVERRLVRLVYHPFYFF